MSRPSYIVLHKNEWERIKTQGNRDITQPYNDKEKTKKEYINKSIETSQKWIQSWPDSIIGHIAHAIEEKEKQHKKDLELIETFKKQKLDDNRKAIQEARQIIFNNSCYGKQLLGALINSKALEEREAQIEFNNKLKHKQNDKELEQHNVVKLEWIAANERENNKIKQKRDDALKCVQINKEIEKQKKGELAKLKENEKCFEIDDQFIKTVLDREKKFEETIKETQRKELEQFEAERKAIEHQRLIENKLDDKLTELYRKEKERINIKMDQVRRKIVHETHNSTKSKHVYEIIDKDLKEKQAKYDEFIETGIKRSEEREKEQIAKQNLKSKLNQVSYECNVDDEKSRNHCDRNSLFVRSHVEKQDYKVKNKRLFNLNNFKKPNKNKYEFTKTKNTLIEKLNERRKEKSPWNGTQDAHAHFAEEASKILQECKYKHYARKVVDEYRRLNGLDSTKLPVSNY